jgi:lysine-N-methylase
MRDEKGLCRVHARFGHDALFEVCATYPRYASEIDGEVELFGTLACPEVARLALLADDGFELAEVKGSHEPRLLRNRFRTDEPYFKPFKQIRAAFVRLLSEPEHPLPEKLFVMLWMADKLRGVLYEGCLPVSSVELDQALAAMLEAGVLGQLSSSYRSLELDGALPIATIVAALKPPPGSRRGAQTDGFDAIWRDLQAVYGHGMTPGVGASDAEVRQIWARYREARAAVPPGVDQRIELCLMRFGVNHALTTPHMLSASLFEYAYDLVIRLACMRFLLTSRLTAFAGSASELDQRIVEVTYAYVRTVEHADVPSRLHELLRAQNLGGLAHAVCFLALWGARES